MRVIAEGIGTAHRVSVEVGYTREFVLINDATCADGDFQQF